MRPVGDNGRSPAAPIRGRDRRSGMVIDEAAFIAVVLVVWGMVAMALVEPGVGGWWRRRTEDDRRADRS